MLELYVVYCIGCNVVINFQTQSKHGVFVCLVYFDLDMCFWDNGVHLFDISTWNKGGPGPSVVTTFDLEKHQVLRPFCLVRRPHLLSSDLLCLICFLLTYSSLRFFSSLL